MPSPPSRKVARHCVPGVELRRCERDLLEHPVRVEERDLALDALARGAQERDRLGVVEGHADVGEDAPPSALQERDRVGVEYLEARHPVDEHMGLTFGQVDRGGVP